MRRSCRTSPAWTAAGSGETVSIPPKGSPAANYAFDVTPARLVTGLITERGVCPATKEGLRRLFSRESNGT